MDNEASEENEMINEVSMNHDHHHLHMDHSKATMMKKMNKKQKTKKKNGRRGRNNKNNDLLDVKPFLFRIPRTGFACKHRAPGYYADMEAACQVMQQ